MTDAQPITHYPVMLPEVLEALKALPHGHILDCTFGGGGHTRALLEKLSDATLTGLDADPAAIPRAEALKADYPERFHFHSINFAQLDSLELGPQDAVLMDLGVSHFQLKTPERGFSFNSEGPLDMRLNNEAGLSAYEFIKQSSRAELTEAIRDFGEEKRWRKVVDILDAARHDGTLQNSTRYLAELVASAIGQRGPGRSRIHPATQTFQGLRIAVNAELDVLTQGLKKAFNVLKQGGRLLVISFHSLEDRIVKRAFRELAGMPVDRSDSRLTHQRKAKANLLTRRPIVPSDKELEENPASRSSKLRILEKTIPFNPNLTPA